VIRAIYAFEVEPAGWRALVAALTEGGFGVERTDGALVVTVGGVRLHTVGLYDGELELAIEATPGSDGDASALLGFARLIGRATGRNVFLTEESSPEACGVAFRAADDRFVEPRRPARRTAFGAALAAEVGALLATLGAGEPPPDADARARTLAGWRALYRPDRYAWHTDLTAEEFVALRAVWGVFGVWPAGDDGDEVACRQFRDAVAGARRLFG
jgi:hypothetical protein